MSTLGLFQVFCSGFGAALGDQLIDHASARREVGEHAFGSLDCRLTGGSLVFIRGH